MKVEIILVARSDNSKQLEDFTAALLTIFNTTPKGIEVDKVESKFRFMDESTQKAM